MKSLLLTIMAGALTLNSAGQSATTNSVASELNGTDLVAELSKSVDSKKVKLGDPVKAILTQDVLSHGKIVIRRGSKLVGHVTEAKARNKEDQESRLGVVFDKAVLKGGGEIDLSAAVRALAPPVRLGAVDKPDEMGPPMGAPMVNQSSSPQPMSGNTSSAGSRASASGTGGGGSANGPSPPANQAMRAQYSAAPFGVALPEGGVMGGGSRGIFGLPGLRLGPAPGGGQTSVISSTSHNVKLDSGTQMVIQVVSPVR